MRTLIALFALTGCEIVLEPYPSDHGHSHDSHTHESHESNDSYETPQSSHGHGPVILSTSQYCGYDYAYSDYVWEFAATINHPHHEVSDIAEVWVDIYDGPYRAFSGYMVLGDYDPYDNVSRWLASTTEYTTNLYCDSRIEYVIETYVMDWDGNYDVVVDYY